MGCFFRTNKQREKFDKWKGAWVPNICNGQNIENLNVLSNPDCLKEYQDIYETLN